MGAKRTKSRDGTDSRQKQLALIHLGKRELGLDDETYRDMLRCIAGVSSAADLDAVGLNRVIDHLRKCGFEKQQTAKPRVSDYKPAKHKEQQLRKIFAILGDLDLPIEYAHGMAKRMYRVDRVHWLPPDQLRGVLIALVKHQRRVNRKNKK